ncbi:MAG: hypothetical protein K9L86_04500 [Candidatus Omnitrophica bacterium]|nr:hypothetical protein [Candidatus Omnitrophota bacterium]
MDKLKKVTIFLILATVLGLNVYLRLFPANFPQLKKRAHLNIEDRMLSQAREFTQKQYPGYNSLIKEKIAKQVVKEGRKNSKGFKLRVNKEYERLKSQYQDDSGQTYLLEVDPYCRKRFTRLTLENGYPGNKIVDGKIYDKFMLAPQGGLVPPERFLYYFSAYLYRAVSFIFPNLSLEKFVFYLPVFLTFVFCIVLYLFCRYFFSNISGIFAIIFIGLSPVFIHRSSAGWFDQDVFNVLFPLLIVWFLGIGLKSKTFIQIVKYSLLASLLLGLYAFSWVGWWFIFAVIVIFFLATLANNFCLHFKDRDTLKKKNAPYLVSLAVFLSGSVIFCLLIAKVEPFSFLYGSLASNLRLGNSLSFSIWPSVLYTVSELKQGSFTSIPVYTGGWAIFMLSLFGLLWTYLREKRGKRADIVLILSCWTFVMFFASLKGLRFTQFLFVPLGIFLSVSLGDVWRLLPNWVRGVSSHKVRSGLILSAVCLICLVVSIPVRRSFSQASIQFPILNDGWYDLMIQIKEKTPENSVINSWWDYGNWFKEIANRRTLVDPQIQDAPITYWMARVFLAGNEEEAVRILRMINNSSDALFDQINSFLGDDFSSIVFLNKILRSEEKNIEAIFKEYKIPKGLAKKIKDVIFVKIPAPAYLFIDETMIYKISAISFLGNWNFAKVYIIKHQDLPKLEVINNLFRVFGLKQSEAELLYEEVMFSRIGREVNEVVSEKWTFPLYLAAGREDSGTVYFDNGIVLALNSSRATMFQQPEKKFKELSFTFIFDGDNLTYNESKMSQPMRFNSGGFFFKDNGQWKCIGVSNKALGESLLAKLYFTKAKTLDYFEPFIALDKANLYAFKIKWKN